MLEASGAEVRLRTAVRRVAASGSGAGGGFSVTSGPASAGGGEAGALSVTEAFDAVVIAAPLEASGLMLDLGGSAAPPRERPFVHTHATFVEAAQLNPKKFGKEAASRTGAVLTTADAGEDGYFAIGVQGYATPANDTEPATCAGGTGGAAAPGAAGAPADAAGTPADAAGAKRCFASAAAAAAAGKPPPRAKPGKPPPLARAAARRRVYKLFSSRPLSDTQLDEILEGRSGDAVRAVWESPGAYPRLLPTAEWPDFELAKGAPRARARAAIPGPSAATSCPSCAPQRGPRSRSRVLFRIALRVRFADHSRRVPCHSESERVPAIVTVLLSCCCI